LSPKVVYPLLSIARMSIVNARTSSLMSSLNHLEAETSKAEWQVRQMKMS